MTTSTPPRPRCGRRLGCRIRWFAVVTLLLATVSTLLLATGTAAAQPPTDPAPPPDQPNLEEVCAVSPAACPGDGTSLPIGPGGASVPEDPAAPNSPPPEMPEEFDVPHKVKMDGLFNIETGYGPLANYNLFADTPWLVDNPLPAIWLALGNIGYSFGKYMVGFTIWFTEWAMSYQMLGWLRGPAEALEEIWRTQLIGELRLREIALLIATLYLAILFLRGYTRRAWRELISTTVINVLAVAIITHPVAFLLGDATEGSNTSVIEGGLLTLTRDISVDVSAAVMGRNPADTSNPATAITEEEINTLLVMPWETLNWGEPVTGSPTGRVNPCFPHSQDVLEQGPWEDNDDRPRKIMESCNGDYAGYNANMTVDRFFGAWAYALAMVLFFILSFALMLIQVLAPYLLLFEGMLLIGALIAALIPRFQNQLTHRIASITSTLGMVIASVLFLSVMIVLLRSLMMVNLGPQLVRFGVIDLTVFAGFFFRAQVAKKVAKMKANVHRSLQRAGRRSRVAPLPAGIRVPPGKTRLGAIAGAHTQAFKQTLAPAAQLGAQMTSAAKTTGRLGGKTVAATLGAPVSWPKAAARTKTVVAKKGTQLRAQLSKARDYATTYAGGVGKATGAVATVTGLRAIYGTAGHDIVDQIVDQSARASDPAILFRRTKELRKRLSEDASGGLPRVEPPPPPTPPPPPASPDTASTAPGELPPGMLPNPPTAAERLRERFRRSRDGRSS